MLPSVVRVGRRVSSDTNVRSKSATGPNIEDRLTPFLRVELSPRSPDDARERGAEVLAATGATRVTWWANQHLGRRDLPRRLAGPDGADLPTLVLYECETPPSPVDDPDDGTVALTFARYPRPPQGRLTGRPTRGLQLVLIHPRAPEQAQALRDWGDFVHLRHIAEASCPGFSIITPYERVTDERTGDGPRFLHLYEMDIDDPEPAFRAMTPLVASRLGGEDSDTFRRWAWHEALVIDYVNTFAYVGEQTSSST